MLPISTTRQGASHVFPLTLFPHLADTTRSNAMQSNVATATRPRPADQPLENLFSPYRLGNVELSNRLVMAPMTRSRAVEGNVPSPMAPTYYAQRAAAGLIITEATQVSPQGVGYIRTPGIHSPEQVTGWRLVTDAVHRAG